MSNKFGRLKQILLSMRGINAALLLAVCALAIVWYFNHLAPGLATVVTGSGAITGALVVLGLFLTERDKRWLRTFLSWWPLTRILLIALPLLAVLNLCTCTV